MGSLDCLKCKTPIPNLCDFDLLGKEITCPNCGNKMTVEFDPGYDPIENEEYHTWWLEQSTDSE